MYGVQYKGGFIPAAVYPVRYGIKTLHATGKSYALIGPKVANVKYRL